MAGIRSKLYRAASLLGWFNAAKRGTLPQRVVRVSLIKWLGRLWR